MITALTFALAHGLIVGIPVFFVIGAGLAYLRYRTDSLYPPILVHMGFNGLQLVIGGVRLAAVDAQPRRGVEEVQAVGATRSRALSPSRSSPRPSRATKTVPCSSRTSTVSAPTAALTSSPCTGRPPTAKWTKTSEPMSSLMSTGAEIWPSDSPSA